MGFRALTIWLAAVMVSITASAGTMHEVRFTQSAKVMVWQDGEWLGQGAAVSVSDKTGAMTSPRIGSGELMTARAQPDSSQSTMTLLIASNSGFEIVTDSAELSASMTVSLMQVGPNAQNKMSAAGPAPGRIFRQSEKTALRPGSPQSQAIEVQISWTGPSAPALRIEATGS